MKNCSKIIKTTKFSKKHHFLSISRYFMNFSIFELFVGIYPRYLGIEGRAENKKLLWSGKDSFLGADNFSIASDIIDLGPASLNLHQTP